MNTVISRRQISMLENMMKTKKDSDKDLSLTDQVIDMFMPVKVGIRDHGLTAYEIAERLGDGRAKDYQNLCGVRSMICQISSTLVKEGFPFGGLKDKGNKRYGFSNSREFYELQGTRKIRMISELKSGMKYLDEDDSMLKLGEKMLKEYNRQLTFEEISA